MKSYSSHFWGPWGSSSRLPGYYMTTLLLIFGRVSLRCPFWRSLRLNVMSVARALAAPLHGGDVLAGKERGKLERRINTGMFRMAPAGVRGEVEWVERGEREESEAPAARQPYLHAPLSAETRTRSGLETSLECRTCRPAPL